MARPLSTAEYVEVWKQCLVTAMHFNDLLMRLRTLGLPVAFTLAGAGTLLGLNVRIGAPEWLWLVVLSMLTGALWTMRLGVPKRAGWDGDGPLGLTPFERGLWLLFPLIGTVGTMLAVFAMTQSGTSHDQIVQMPLSVLALGAADTLILAIYVLDRFYYYGLLIGAVEYLESIETRIGINLTSTVNVRVSRWHAQHVVSTLYLLPAVMSFGLGMALAVAQFWAAPITK